MAYVDQFRKREEDRRQKQLQAAFEKGVLARIRGETRERNPMISKAWVAAWDRGWIHQDKKQLELSKIDGPGART
jgi:hypothetical protein